MGFSLQTEGKNGIELTQLLKFFFSHLIFDCYRHIAALFVPEKLVISATTNKYLCLRKLNFIFFADIIMRDLFLY